jgi:hypothetical protein
VQRPEIGIPLNDGNSGAIVYRVGDTVRREPKPWSSSVDALLLHLESVGYEGAPRALGYDTLGRQVLSYIPGRAAAEPTDLGEGDVRQVGRLIREFHDAAATFAPRPEAVWNVAIVPDRQELICHHDMAPWNFVRGEGISAFIDWDGAGLGSRLWDLAHAAHGFTPLSVRANLDTRALGARLRALVDGYELCDVDRQALVDLLAPRIFSMYSLLLKGKKSGTQPWARLWELGHGAVWLEDHSFVTAHLTWWSDALR